MAELPARGARLGGRLAVVPPLLFLLSFLPLRYDPAAQVPTSEDLVAGEKLVARLRSIDGEILMPGHGYLAVRAGKGSTAHTMALSDVFRSDPVRTDLLYDEYSRAVQERRFAAVVTENPFLGAELRAFYDRAGPLFPDGDALLPVTGFPSRPGVLWLRPR